MVEITDKAKDKINELLGGASGKFLRLYFDGAG